MTIGIRVFLIAILMICGFEAANAEQRVALVIGNSSYKLISPLNNPKNDADLMEATLKTTGFDVIKATDVDSRGMRKAIKRFGDRLRAAGKGAIGLFYYAGHGVQSRGENFLIPLRAEISSEADLDIEAISASNILRQMEFAGNALNLVILDACRNNPFATGFRSAARGFTRLQAPTGSLVAFSAAPGQVAVDGEGNNSPYTAALAKAMLQPGVPVEQMFKRVRVSVKASTANAQTPWEESSLLGNFYFTPGKESSEEKPSINPNLTDEGIFWTTVRNSDDITVLEEFLRKFPNGTFSGLAKIKLNKLSRKNKSDFVDSNLAGSNKKEESGLQKLASLYVENDNWINSRKRSYLLNSTKHGIKVSFKPFSDSIMFTLHYPRDWYVYFQFDGDQDGVLSNRKDLSIRWDKDDACMQSFTGESSLSRCNDSNARITIGWHKHRPNKEVSFMIEKKYIETSAGMKFKVKAHQIASKEIFETDWLGYSLP